MVKVAKLEDKDFDSNSNYFGQGTHVVLLSEGRRGESQNTGTEFVEFDVTGTNDETDNVRLYLSPAAWPYTAKKLAGIAVHNKATDAEREAVRKAFKAIDDTDQLDDKFLAKFKGMQAWILVEEDLNAPKPNGGYYLRSNLFHYEPKPKQITAEQLTSEVNNAKPVELSEIPF